MSSSLEVVAARRGIDRAAGMAVGRPEARLKPLSLARNFSWVAAGNAATGLSRWGMFVVLAQIGGLAMVGEVVLAFAITTPIVALANLGLRSAQVTDVTEEYRFGDYLGLRLISIVACLAATAGVIGFGGYSRPMAWLVLVTAVGKSFESVSEIFHGLMQRHERMDRIGLALMMQGPLSLALLAAGCLLTGSPVGGMIGFGVALAATLLLYEIPNGYSVLRAQFPTPASTRQIAKELLPRWDRTALARLTWMTLPLGIVASLTALSPNLPRYVVEQQLGKQALGIFAAIVALSSLGTMVTTALGQSSIPRLARYHARGDRRAYGRLLALLLGVAAAPGLFLIVVMAAAADPVLGLLYGPEVAGHRGLAVLLMVAMTLHQLAGPLGRGIESMRRFRLQMIIRLATALVLLAILPPMVSHFGLLGAAWGLVASGLATVAFYSLAIKVSLRHATGAYAHASGPALGSQF